MIGFTQCPDCGSTVLILGDRWACCNPGCKHAEGADAIVRDRAKASEEKRLQAMISDAALAQELIPLDELEEYAARERS